MRVGHWFSSSIGLGLALLLAGCPQNGGTLPTSCSATSPCATGQYCDAGTCTPGPGPCKDSTGCAADQYCDAGSCMPGPGPCTDSAGCMTGQYCDAGHCTTPCLDASGCSASQYCAAGNCVPKVGPGQPCSPGTGHTANELCSSAVCLGGACCAAACPDTDPACSATACDSTGACVYPDAGTVCGAPAGCDGGSFVPASGCNGAGGCTASSGVSCTPYLCSGAACASMCTTTGDCAAGHYCGNTACVLKEDAGAGCVLTGTSTADEACLSDVCLGARCCLGACSTGDPVCGANACDVAGGCVYPDAGTGCGPAESCTAGVHTIPSGCAGDGGCAVSTPVPCGAYTCDAVGLACYASCTIGNDTPCASGNYCAAGGCTAQLTPGLPCAADDFCLSAVCRGNCCTAACDTDATTNCLGACDTTGACQHPTCNPGYGCAGGLVCKTTCASNADCAPNSSYTCSNPVNGSCCLPVANGATVFVDGKLGVDTNCCDTALTACRTITYAMGQIAAASATGVTLSVTWNAAPAVRSDWAPATAETYPIHLGLGVTLKAPGIFFTPPAPGPGVQPIDVFDVYAYNAADNGRVTIEGDPAGDFAFIGFDSTQATLTGAAVAVNSGVAAQTAVPLTLTKVWMNAQTAALNLGAGAAATVGPDPVIIGSGAATANPLPKVVSPGSGIYCQGTAAGRASLADDPAGANVLEIDSQDDSAGHGPSQAGIYAYDYCDVVLSQSPVIGIPPPCANPKADGEGILVQGGSTLSLVGATIQCMFNHAIDVGENTTLVVGHPSATIDKTLIQYTGQTGLKVNDGSVGPVTNSTIYHCRFGTVLQLAATLDISGGGNTVACSTDTEPGAFGPGLTAGIDVWNNSAAGTINAANVLWDQAPPALWSCADTFGSLQTTNCTCVSGTCTGTGVAAPDDSDALYYSASTAATPIDQSDAGVQNTYPGCN